MKKFTLPHEDTGPDFGRRRFLQGSAAAAVLAGSAGAALHAPPARAQSTSARIVIVGAGAAGVSLATRLDRALDGARITIVDPREDHYYQPGLTLVATGAWERDRVVDRNARYLPRNVDWVREAVDEYDPESNRVRTDRGNWLEYDFLLVASGLQLDFRAIEGLDPDRVGENGLGCVYDTPDRAAATAQAIAAFVDAGGRGLFIQPPGGIKCAGAPFKVAMLTEHRLRQGGSRERAELLFATPHPSTGSIFSQPDMNDFLKVHLPEDRGFSMEWEHQLVALDHSARTAIFATPEGEREVEYDFIHAVPPMSAPAELLDSELADHDGDFPGWMAVDRHTLRHPRYPNVFGVGDVVGTPIGKTAASVKAQVPVAVDNLLAVMREAEPTAAYGGYTSCPLITEFGRGILVEFDYSLQMTPSFDFIDPYREQWVPWLMKDRMLHAAYKAMLRGRI